MMRLTPQDDAATLAMLKTINPDHDRIWRAWDDLGRKGNRNGTGPVRLLDAPDGAGAMTHPCTPGPWMAKARATGGYNIVAVDDVLEDVVIGTVTGNEHSLETAYANAQLMAAAPKMSTIVLALIPCALLCQEMLEADGETEAAAKIAEAVDLAQKTAEEYDI